jgi:hypothetical protein
VLSPHDCRCDRRPRKSTTSRQLGNHHSAVELQLCDELDQRKHDVINRKSFLTRSTRSTQSTTTHVLQLGNGGHLWPPRSRIHIAKQCACFYIVSSLLGAGISFVICSELCKFTWICRTSMQPPANVPYAASSSPNKTHQNIEGNIEIVMCWLSFRELHVVEQIDVGQAPALACSNRPTSQVLRRKARKNHMQTSNTMYR